MQLGTLLQALIVNQAGVYLSDYAEITASLTCLENLIMLMHVCDTIQIAS